MKLLTRMARSFVAGETAEQGLKQVHKLKDKGIMVTLDILGESVKDRAQSDKSVQDYLDLLDVLRKNNEDCHISLKLTQMGLDIDDEYCFQNMVKIVGKARESGRFVRLDMEGSPLTQRTLDIFFRLRKKFDNVGVAVQAYLHRTRKDVADIVAAGGKIRLCKGAYKEPAEVAIKKMKEIRENFKELTVFMLKNKSYPALATHDSKLIEWAKIYVQENNIPREAFEFQMLYGLRNKLQAKLAADGYRIRAYVPFGTHWLPYFIRRLRERKENVFLVLKNMFR